MLFTFEVETDTGTEFGLVTSGGPAFAEDFVRAQFPDARSITVAEEDPEDLIDAQYGGLCLLQTC